MDIPQFYNSTLNEQPNRIYAKLQFVRASSLQKSLNGPWRKYRQLIN